MAHYGALRLDKRDKKQVVSSHEGTKGTKVFGRHGAVFLSTDGHRLRRFFEGAARVYLTQRRRDAEVFLGHGSVFLAAGNAKIAKRFLGAVRGFV